VFFSSHITFSRIEDFHEYDQVKRAACEFLGCFPVEMVKTLLEHRLKFAISENNLRCARAYIYVLCCMVISNTADAEKSVATAAPLVLDLLIQVMDSGE
jgi:hypothetical protein